jgi:hypothetical protein
MDCGGCKAAGTLSVSQAVTTVLKINTGGAGILFVCLVSRREILTGKGRSSSARRMTDKKRFREGGMGKR